MTRSVATTPETAGRIPGSAIVSCLPWATAGPSSTWAPAPARTNPGPVRDRRRAERCDGRPTSRRARPPRYAALPHRSCCATTASTLPWRSDRPPLGRSARGRRARARRAARGPVVILTVDADVGADMWLLRDYLPRRRPSTAQRSPHWRAWPSGSAEPSTWRRSSRRGTPRTGHWPRAWAHPSASWTRDSPEHNLRVRLGWTQPSEASRRRGGRGPEERNLGPTLRPPPKPRRAGRRMSLVAHP